jgi:hypothetical protein
MVDACVRLWVIADFLVFKELQHEAVRILENHCEEKARALCVYEIPWSGHNSAMADDELDATLEKLFRGVHTAYTQYRHSLPCQKVLIDLFYAIRFSVFQKPNFRGILATAPTQFSHELLMATIGGRKSKWAWNMPMEYQPHHQFSHCTMCNKNPEEADQWAPDLSIPESIEINLSWRCIPCLEKYGFPSRCRETSP